MTVETDPTWSATLCGTMKIPDPIIVPTTMAIAPRLPMARGSSVGAGDSAPETKAPGDDDLADVDIEHPEMRIFNPQFQILILSCKLVVLGAALYQTGWLIILRGFRENQTPFQVAARRAEANHDELYCRTI